MESASSKVRKGRSGRVSRADGKRSSLAILVAQVSPDDWRVHLVSEPRWQPRTLELTDDPARDRNDPPPVGGGELDLLAGLAVVHHHRAPLHREVGSDGSCN